MLSILCALTLSTFAQNETNKKEETTKKLNLEEPLIGKIKARFGAKYLRENQDWIR